MNAHAALSADPAPYHADTPAREAVERARALAARQMAVLERLAEAGIAVALAVEREAQARTHPARAPEAAAEIPEPSAAAPPPEAPQAGAEPGRSLQGLAMAYARAARAVRLTVLLQSRLMRELEAAERQAEFNAPSQARRLQAARREASEARKARIERIVGRVAEMQSMAQEAAQALVEAAADRLDDEDIYGDVLTRPMGELVARICRDLNLDPDWSALAREAWAEAERAAGAPGSPFAVMAAGELRAGEGGLSPPPWRGDPPHDSS